MQALAEWASTRGVMRFADAAARDAAPAPAIGGAPCPPPADATSGPAHMPALAEWASPRGVMRSADAAARDAAITTPDAGMVAWLDTPGSLTVRTASAWRTLWSSP